MKKNTILLAILTLFVVNLNVTSVKAIDYENQIKFNYRYDRSLNNTCYWVSSSASTFTSAINNAAYDWAHYSNPIVMTPVSSSYATHMDFYGKNSSYWAPYNGVYGETQHYLNGGTYIYPDNGNWFYADILLSLDDLPSANPQGTIAHEIGHAFVLAHWNSNPYSIMTQDSCGRIVSTVQEADNQHLNQKY